MKDRIKEFIKRYKNWDFIILAIALLIIYVAVYPLAQSAEMFVYDVMIKVYTQATAAKKAIADDRIVLVVIDDESLEEVGRWPWPRKMYIDMFDYLQNHSGAKVIAFDSFIRGKDTWNPDSDEYFFSSLKDFPSVKMGLDFTQDIKGNDQSDSKTALITKYALKNINDFRRDKNNQGMYRLNTKPIPELIENVDGMGSVLTVPDEDKKIRMISHIYYASNKYFPSLSLLTILTYFDIKSPEIELFDDFIRVKSKQNEFKIPVEKSNKYYNTPQGKDKNLFVKIVSLPITTFEVFKNKKVYYNTWIKWYKPIDDTTLTHHSVSAYKIFNAYNALQQGKIPELDPEVFKDKIVVIGSTATGVSTSGLDDIKATPLSPYQPGVDIQATAIDNILNQDFMDKVPAYVNILILFGFISTIVVLSLRSQDVNESLIAVLVLAMFYFVIVFYWLYPGNIIVDTVTPIIYLCITPMIIYTFQYFIERRKRGQIQNVFSKFVSSEVMGEILKDPDTVNLGGERAEITILFSDIRGFTTMSEKLPPEEVSAILIEYFKIMEPIIKKHNGTVDNYMGDAIMAIFGAPVRHEDHALRAVKAAVEMQHELKKLQEKWKKQGKQAFGMGIGINTGYTFLGYVGSKNLMHYTAIGDAVNIASRLEHLNKLFNTSVIISHFTYEKVRNHVEVRALKKENIRGRSEPVMLYELKGIRDLKDIIM